MTMRTQINIRKGRLGAMILGIVLMSVPLGRAATFYVSDSTGDDSRTAAQAQKIATPWKTIQKAASTMSPGDTCVIRAGTYRETVIPKDGQRFEPFQNEKPLITGCEVVSGWTAHTGQIHKAGVKQKVVDVFVDGKNMDKARFPDEDGNRFNKTEWLPTKVEKGGGQTGFVTFTDGLDQDYVGGFFTGLNGDNCYQANMGEISEQDGDRLRVIRTNHRWNNSPPKKFDGPGVGYITDHLNCLTSPKEWHWQDGTLYLYAPGGAKPSSKRVEARVRLWGFDCSGKSDVELVGLHFKGASVLMKDSENSTIDGCVFRYVSPWGNEYYSYRRGRSPDLAHYNYGDTKDGTSGIHISGTGNTIKNSYVAYGWGALISLRGNNNTAENNYVEEANWQCRQDAVCITVCGANQKVLRNTLRKSNSMLISLRDIARQSLIAPKIKYNDCRDYGYVMLDGGTAAIYYNANSDMKGGEFAYNVISGNHTKNDRVSTGIYLDDGARNATIHHNVIDGGGHCRSGIFTHRGDKDIYVYHNSCWGYTQSAWSSSVWKGTRDTATMIFRNNHSGGRGYSQKGVKTWVTEDHNRENVPASELVNVEKMNFRIKKASSASIDAGVIIDGLNDGYKIDAPDLGAYEFQGVDWKAGSTVKPPRR